MIVVFTVVWCVHQSFLLFPKTFGRRWTLLTLYMWAFTLCLCLCRVSLLLLQPFCIMMIIVSGAHSTKLWERAHREIKLVWNFYCVCSCESILWNWRQSFFETLSVVLCLREILPKMRGNRSYRHHPLYTNRPLHTHIVTKPIRKNQHADLNYINDSNTLVRLVDGIDNGGDSIWKMPNRNDAGEI